MHSYNCPRESFLMLSRNYSYDIWQTDNNYWIERKIKSLPLFSSFPFLWQSLWSSWHWIEMSNEGGLSVRDDGCLLDDRMEASLTGSPADSHRSWCTHWKVLFSEMICITLTLKRKTTRNLCVPKSVCLTQTNFEGKRGSLSSRFTSCWTCADPTVPWLHVEYAFRVFENVHFWEERKKFWNDFSRVKVEWIMFDVCRVFFHSAFESPEVKIC
jgi:hypothetical protein